MNVRATLTTATLRRFERLLTIVLTIAVLDTAYLSWRYIALHANLVSPGTGICSWTASVDCDQVLLTPQARAFYVPNAVLGFGFYFGCLIWWVGGRGLGVAYRHHVIRTLAVWLAVATLFTLRFFWLLIHLKAFCPFCPWNHLLTYLALAIALLIWRAAPRSTATIPRKPLIALVSLCVAQFWVWQVTWIIAHWRGLM